jgi:SAM-dependent methyltransferase
MSIRVSLQADLREETASQLEEGLAAYYNSSPRSYYLEADRAATQYTHQIQPFHCDLASRVRAGFSVIEVGCGSAHFCPHVEKAGGSYTGVDHGPDLLAENRKRFPRARFVAVGTELEQTYDLVASLYTIEHVVDPQRYLRKLWDLCRPGGLIGVICPDFVDGEGYPPSFYYGITPRHLRAKIASMSLIDALTHLTDLFILAPRWKRRARSSAPGAFWMNLAPRILAGTEYTIDADAVHLPRLKDLVWWLTQRGGRILETSLSLSLVNRAVLKHNCYVLVEKPGPSNR